MGFARHIGSATAGLLLVALGACATTQGNLTSSADRLEHNATALARDERGADYPANSNYSRDARELADQAHDFRRLVEDRRADDRDVKASFESLSRSYHTLRDDADRAESRTAQADLKPVTDAYLDVEREMGGYPDSHRYARDRYTSER